MITNYGLVRLAVSIEKELKNSKRFKSIYKFIQ